MSVPSSLSSEELEAMKQRFKNQCNADLIRQQSNEAFINTVLLSESAQNPDLNSNPNQTHINFTELIDKLDEDIHIGSEDKEKINKKLKLMK